MRFRQLNSNPNSIMRKKLVKSKKSWIVVSSLSLAGGLFLLGGPTSVVKADTDTASVKTSVVSTTKASSTTTSSTTKSLTTTPKESTSSTTSPVVSSNSSDATTTKNSTPVTTEKIATDTSSTNKNQETSTVKDSTATTANTQTDTSKSENTNAVKSDPTDNIKTPVTEKPAIDTVDTQSDTKKVENTDTVKDESTDDTKAPVTDTTTNTDKNATNVVEPVTTTTADLKVSNLMANLALSKAQLADLGVQATALAITPENATLEDGNIAEGMQGTTPWSIDQSGVLHLGDKNKTTTLADNKTTTTDKVSTGSSNTDVSTVTSSPTSPWAGHADSIKTITFDGNVNTASDMNHMFSDLSNLTTITNADKLITPQGSDDDEDKTIKNATGLFANDPKLTSISTISGTTGAQSNTVDLSGWKLGSVTSTEDMFLNDSSIEHIIFPSAQEDTLTKNLNSRYMFKNDTSLKDISFPNWQFRSGDFDMSGIFQNDTSLTTLDLSSWNMNSNTETGDSSKGEGMFDGTDSLTSLHLSVNNKFKNYTGLSSAQGSKWIGGGKTLLADPTGSDGSTTYNLNNLTANLGTYVKGGTEFKPDGSTATPLNFTLIVPSNMGDIPIPVTGTIYSSVTGDVPQKDGYTANYTQVQGNILADKAVTSYYVTYTANPYTTKVSTSKGSQDVDIPAGVVGTTSNPISLPSVNGYIAPQIKVQYTKDGNIITDLKGNVISDDNKLTYTGEPLDNNAAVAVTDPTTGKSVSIDVPDGKVGDSVTLNIPNYDNDGYTA
ncbi:BspA family leucine-rich repeat surface protein, partial [Companilactobacillus musae]